MLESHTNAIEQVLLAQSEAAKNAGHPNLRGGPREWFIRDFLENHLPSSLEIGQGEIIDENTKPEPNPNEYRPQVDMVVYRKHLPKIMYSKDNIAFLAEGVIATIESKSRLSEEELKEACKASRKHKELKRSLPLHSFGETPEHILSYVVAFDGPVKIQTVANWMPRIRQDLDVSEDKLADMVIVLGKGAVWNTDKFPLIPPRDIPQGHSWAYISQNDRNLFLLFTHLLSWMSSLSSPPDTRNYSSSILFQEYSTV